MVAPHTQATDTAAETSLKIELGEEDPSHLLHVPPILKRKTKKGKETNISPLSDEDVPVGLWGFCFLGGRSERKMCTCGLQQAFCYFYLFLLIEQG